MKSKNLPPSLRSIDGGKSNTAAAPKDLDPPKRDTRAKHLACPRGMSKPEQKAFRGIVKHLTTHHMLNNADAPTLRQLAEVTVRRDQALKIIHGDRNTEGDGMMVKSSTGSRIRHPMFITIEKCDTQLIAIFKELGLTPGARARRGQS